MARTQDPWPEFIEKYLYSLMRNLVSFRGSMSGQEYVRSESLLRRLVVGKERQLRLAVLQDVQAQYELTRHLGLTLEDAFNRALSAVAAPETPQSSSSIPSTRPQLRAVAHTPPRSGVHRSAGHRKCV